MESCSRVIRRGGGRVKITLKKKTQGLGLNNKHEHGKENKLGPEGRNMSYSPPPLIPQANHTKMQQDISAATETSEVGLHIPVTQKHNIGQIRFQTGPSDGNNGSLQ